MYIMSLQTGSVVDSIPVPDTATLNGMAALPRSPHVILGEDSIDGRIFSIDTQTKAVEVLLKYAALAPDTGISGMPLIGINDLRIHKDFLYFTNSNRGTFSRFQIDNHGHKIGEFEILVRSPAANKIHDDFTFDLEANVYIAVHPSSVVKVTPEGVQTTIAGLESSTFLKEPISTAVANDGKFIYVVTGGLFYADPREGGQVIQIHL